MFPMKRFVSSGLMVLLLGTLHAGGEDRTERLGEPLFRLTHDRLETEEPVKETRAVTVSAPVSRTFLMRMRVARAGCSEERPESVRSSCHTVPIET